MLVIPDDFSNNLPQLKNYFHNIIEFTKNDSEIYDDEQITRTANPSWTTSFRSAGLGYGCVPQVLYNIYRNYRKQVLNWTSVGNEMNTANNIVNNQYYLFNHSQIQTYLTYKGVSTTYSATSGKLSYNLCDSILNNGYYILMISSGTDYNDDGYYHGVSVYHATALVLTPTATTIKIADPHGTTNTTELIYITASFYSSGIYYTWNSGYYAHLMY